MSLLDRFIAWLGWGQLPVAPPARRRLRAVCEYCGKDIAVIASTGRLWRHACTEHAALDDGPGPHDQHDRREEAMGLR